MVTHVSSNLLSHKHCGHQRERKHACSHVLARQLAPRRRDSHPSLLMLFLFFLPHTTMRQHRAQALIRHSHATAKTRPANSVRLQRASYASFPLSSLPIPRLCFVERKIVEVPMPPSPIFFSMFHKCRAGVCLTSIVRQCTTRRCRGRWNRR